MFRAAACQDGEERANLFQKHFEISRETNFQRGTGRWDGSGSFIPALIKKDNPSCHREKSLSLKEKSKRALARMVSRVPAKTPQSG